MNELPRKAFTLLYPNRNVNSYNLTLKYSGKFSDYGANVKHLMGKIDFSISKKWIGVNESIIIGLLHSLYIKIFNTKNPNTLFYIDLYNAYLKNVHVAIPKIYHDEVLASSFDRVNDKYFVEKVETTNFKWHSNKRAWGFYDFKTDTISMNLTLKNKEIKYLDYVMYHEMLHKALKFHSKDGRSTYHTKEFRQREKQFEDYQQVEKTLNSGFNQKKTSNIFINLLKRLN
tara:strand:- start:1501 stop:2187 length:687 start_codon:yes stop_codon:yes gene_type:complete